MKQGLLLAADTGEEGLGNLKGLQTDTEGIMAIGSIRYYGLRRHVWRSGKTKLLAPLRYKVKVKTEGGHSVWLFGNRNAIHQLAPLINVLYAYKVPTTSKTTW